MPFGANLMAEAPNSTEQWSKVHRLLSPVKNILLVPNSGYFANADYIYQTDTLTSPNPGTRGCTRL